MYYFTYPDISLNIRILSKLLWDKGVRITKGLLYIPDHCGAHCRLYSAWASQECMRYANGYDPHPAGYYEDSSALLGFQWSYSYGLRLPSLIGLYSSYRHGVVMLEWLPCCIATGYLPHISYSNEVNITMLLILLLCFSNCDTVDKQRIKSSLSRHTFQLFCCWVTRQFLQMVL